MHSHGTSSMHTHEVSSMYRHEASPMYGAAWTKTRWAIQEEYIDEETEALNKKGRDDLNEL